MFSPKLKQPSAGPVRLNCLSPSRPSMSPKRDTGSRKTLDISELNYDSNEIESNEHLSPFGGSLSIKRRKSCLGLPQRLGAKSMEIGSSTNAMDGDIDVQSNKENSKNSLEIDYTDNFKLSGNYSNSNRSSTSSVSSNLSSSNGSNPNVGFRRVEGTASSKRKSFINFGGGVNSSATTSCNSPTNSNSSSRSSLTSTRCLTSNMSSAWHIDHFRLGKPLGKGKFGNVYMGHQKSSNHPVALKVLMKTSMIAANTVHSLRREVEIQSRLNHENIVQLHGYFHDPKSVYLILEYVNGGELYKYISRQKDQILSETNAKKILSDISAAVKYLHAYNVIHRDIKPENMLVVMHADDTVKQVKLSDFGWAVHVPPIATSISEQTVFKLNEEKTSNPIDMRYTMCGTAEYLAPEIIKCTGHGFPVDYWAVGIFLYELLEGRTPFTIEQRSGTELSTKPKVDRITNGVKGSNELTNQPLLTCIQEIELDKTEDKNLMQMYNRIVAHGLNTTGESIPHIIFHNSKLTETCQLVIRSLLHPIPANRMTMTELIGHAWYGEHIL